MSQHSFNTGEPLGFFITWTCYGTWLPGDQRGWQRKGQGGTQPPNELFHKVATSSMTEPAFLMTAKSRQVVEETIKNHCEIRDWHYHAVSARSNHVHVVVTTSGDAPKTVTDQLKAWCTRKLKRIHIDRKKFWTEGASRRYLNTETSLNASIEYVNETQDRKGIKFN